jgi:hypothetical protein
VFYLYLHLTVLSPRCGEHAWSEFLRSRPAGRLSASDVLLLFGLLYHGLNVDRVALWEQGSCPTGRRPCGGPSARSAPILLLGGTLHIYGSK